VTGNGRSAGKRCTEMNRPVENVNQNAAMLGDDNHAGVAQPALPDGPWWTAATVVGTGSENANIPLVISDPIFAPFLTPFRTNKFRTR
jgi:hypothetical protein